jgi:hypothetical protein
LPSRKRSVYAAVHPAATTTAATTAAIAAPAATARGRRNACLTVLVELEESVNASNLLELGAKALDLSAKLDAELGVRGLVRRKMLLGLPKVKALSKKL